MVKFHVKGEKELNAALTRWLQHATGDAAQRLYQEAETIMTQSKMLVPVDTGALRNSGKVMTPVRTGDRITVELGYGDSAVGYAVPVHEIPPPPQVSEGGRSAFHQPPTSWKYLERPALAAFDRIYAALADAVKKAKP